MMEGEPRDVQHQRLATSAENCSQSASFGATITLNRDFAAFVLFDGLCCAGDCSQLSRFRCFLFRAVP